MKKTSSLLAYMGTLPFVAGAFCAILGIPQVPPVGSVENAIGTYGLVIGSFMAGSHWGLHLHQRGIWANILQKTSIILALVLWAGFMMLRFKTFILLLMGVFGALLFIDHTLFKNHILSKSYAMTRYGVSGIVLVSLMITRLA